MEIIVGKSLKNIIGKFDVGARKYDIIGLRHCVELNYGNDATGAAI